MGCSIYHSCIHALTRKVACVRQARARVHEVREGPRRSRRVAQPPVPEPIVEEQQLARGEAGRERLHLALVLPRQLHLARVRVRVRLRVWARVGSRVSVSVSVRIRFRVRVRLRARVRLGLAPPAQTRPARASPVEARSRWPHRLA